MSNLAEVTRLLRKYLRDVGFVRLHKYLVGVARYHAHPSLLESERVSVATPAAYCDGDSADLGLALCLMVDAPLALAPLAPAQRALVDGLLALGLLGRAGGGDTVRLAGAQLTSFQGAPLFIDRRLSIGDASHEVYFGPDTALLTYYIDTDRIGCGDAVLDLGTGSGAMALYLARFSDRVVATDVMPAPLWLADLNRHLNGREHTLELRREAYLETIARGQRYQAVVFNPPFLAVPEGLAAPAYAAGIGADGLDYCRMLVELFDSLVAPSGTAYMVAALPGDDRQPHFFAELERYAAALDLSIDLFVDGRLDLRTDPEPLQRHAEHLLKRNPGLLPEQALARVEQLYRRDMRADCLYLATMVLGHAPGARARLFARGAVS